MQARRNCSCSGSTGSCTCCVVRATAVLPISLLLSRGSGHATSRKYRDVHPPISKSSGSSPPQSGSPSPPPRTLDSRRSTHPLIHLSPFQSTNTHHHPPHLPLSLIPPSPLTSPPPIHSPYTPLLFPIIRQRYLCSHIPPYPTPPLSIPRYKIPTLTILVRSSRFNDPPPETSCV